MGKHNTRYAYGCPRRPVRVRAEPQDSQLPKKKAEELLKELPDKKAPSLQQYLEEKTTK